MKYFTFISILILWFSQPSMLWAGSYQKYIEMGNFFNDAGEIGKAYEKYLQAYANASTKREKKTSLASLAVTSLKLGNRVESEGYLRKILSLFPNDKWTMRFAEQHDISLTHEDRTQSGCVEGYSPKALRSFLSLTGNFIYHLPNVINWVDGEVMNGFSVELNEEGTLQLSSQAPEEQFETFICRIKDGVQVVIRKSDNHKWRKTYKFFCNDKIFIQTVYVGVYFMGASASCER